MSTAPLSREDQIGLMQNASSRLEAFVQKWRASDVVSEIMTEPHPSLTDGDLYSRNDELIERCG